MSIQDLLLYFHFTRHSALPPSTSRAITANGFAGRFFNVRSLCTCFLVRRITAEMESADSLDCHDPAIMDHFSCGNDRSSSPFFPCRSDILPGPHALQHTGCIITSWSPDPHTPSTVRTHREFLHAGPFPVIWEAHPGS